MLIRHNSRQPLHNSGDIHLTLIVGKNGSNEMIYMNDLGSRKLSSLRPSRFRSGYRPMTIRLLSASSVSANQDKNYQARHLR